jgi:electron transfer flavoprotein beta subunit
MGADEAILVSDPAITTLDTQGAARILAAAIQKIGDADLALFGRQSLDEGSGLTPAQTARVLGWPMLALAGAIKIEAETVHVERIIEEGRQMVSARMPAVLSVVQSIGEPRYPSFMGIRRASRTEIPVWSLADLGIEVPAPVVSRLQLIMPLSREVSCEMISGDTPDAVADTLADKILAEKVL